MAFPQHSIAPTGAGPAPLLLFVAGEAWFFASHFLPAAEAARAAGFRVALAAPEPKPGDGAAAGIEDAGARLAAAGVPLRPLDDPRADRGPLAVFRGWRSLRAILRAERPAAVHAFGLRACLAAEVAARSVRPAPRRVLAVTGLGHLASASGFKAVALRRAILAALALAARSPFVRLVVENGDDAAALGARAAHAPLILDGAGVDGATFPARPLPAPPADAPGALRLALVARLVRSKGVDVAVEAVRLARARGVDVRLTLHGGPDAANPGALDETWLREVSDGVGVAWAGPTRDASGAYAAAEVAVLPSRGGEGLPKTLVEAAATGRPILTADVPGCRDLVRNGIEGFVVPPGDAAALADAMARLAADPGRRARMGEAARARFEDRFERRHVLARLEGLYGELRASAG